MGAICCHGNQSFDPIWSKTSCSLSPIPMMLLIKFHCDRPTGCRDIHVWNCGRRTTTDDGRTPDHGYTKSSPTSLRLNYYHIRKVKTIAFTLRIRSRKPAYVVALVPFLEPLEDDLSLSLLLSRLLSLLDEGLLSRLECDFSELSAGLSCGSSL